MPTIYPAAMTGNQATDRKTTMDLAGFAGAQITVASMSDVTIQRLDERPDLMARVYEVDFTWPEFMSKDP
ncbi:MAG: hypothetical protein JO287_11430, partial [Pseudonocardiales bacterium]|nr:hypothetical protein [Pseudonocardiales bacterium]